MEEIIAEFDKKCIGLRSIKMMLSFRTIVLLSLARLLPMLEHLRKGLQLYGLIRCDGAKHGPLLASVCATSGNEVKTIEIKSFVTVSCEQKPTNL